MRVVIDTNVFVSSFFGGKPRKIIDKWFSGELVLCLSLPILREYFDVLERFDFDEKGLLFKLMSMFEKQHNLLFLANPREKQWVEDDPADNKFIACAIAFEAEYIISGDKHLRHLGKIGPVRIVSPDEMLKIVG